MTRRTSAWAGVWCLLLAAALGVGQQVLPRAADFLQPQRLDSWRIIGPGGGGSFYYPNISPFDPNLVFVSTDMTGCYVSENGGHTWRTFNLRARCNFIFDSKLPNRIYAIALELWRSDDRGRTWSLVNPDPSATIHYADDESVAFIHSTSGFEYPISSMAVDPDDSNTLYASMSSDRLEVSRDAGRTWKILAEGCHAEQLWVDPTSPRRKRIIYTHDGNKIGTWDGDQFVKRPVPEVGDFQSVAFGTISDGAKPVLYIAADYVVKHGQITGGGVMATRDGGQSWRSLNDGILKLVAKGTWPELRAVATSQKHAGVIYLSYRHLSPPNDQKRYYGVLKSSDGGETWDPVRKEDSAIAPNMHTDWISLRYGPDWGEEPVNIAVDDNNPNLVYTTDLGRVMRSADGGKNWYGVFSQSTGNGYTTTGLDVTTSYGVHFDPFNPKRMFITYADIGLMRSEDGGESWVSGNAVGVPRAWTNTTYWMEFDPAVKGRVWAAMAQLHDLPRQRELNHWSSREGGVATSTDGGNTWTAASHGLPPTLSPTHILLDAKSPAASRVLYIAAMGRGVFKSTDGGQNWRAKNAGLPDHAPLTWRMAIDSEGTLYVVTIRRSEDGKYGTDQDGWLFRSRNGGDTWERVTLPQGVNGPVGITVDPKDPARLYLSAWARYKRYEAGPIPPDGGVFLSIDRGEHWQNVLHASGRIYDVTVDPRNSDLVYAAGFEASAWRSADRGKTWRRIGGFNFKFGHRVIPDPADINKIYVTTFGNSVWHGPATGDPNAVEDIVAPRLMRFTAVHN
jgi:photosystem II stability/assembly factor-like uncharacterized protein